MSKDEIIEGKEKDLDIAMMQMTLLQGVPIVAETGRKIHEEKTRLGENFIKNKLRTLSHDVLKKLKDSTAQRTESTKISSLTKSLYADNNHSLTTLDNAVKTSKNGLEAFVAMAFYKEYMNEYNQLGWETKYKTDIESAMATLVNRAGHQEGYVQGQHDAHQAIAKAKAVAVPVVMPAVAPIAPAVATAPENGDVDMYFLIA